MSLEAHATYPKDLPRLLRELPSWALSIQQPWTWCLAHGHKGVENRSWTSAFRGPLFLHAGRTFDRPGYDWIRATFPSIALPATNAFVLGGVVGSARMTGVAGATSSSALEDCDRPWFVGPYGFVMREQAPLPFVPMRGALGFFHVPDAVRHALAMAIIEGRDA